MTNQQSQVLKFMRTFDQHLEVVPKIVPQDVSDLRKGLIIEECAELVDAMRKHDLIKIADGMADLMYVVLGAACAYGFDLEPVFDEVHRSNMSKVGGKKDHMGKLIKPASYSPANIAPVLVPWKG